MESFYDWLERTGYARLAHWTQKSPWALAEVVDTTCQLIEKAAQKSLPLEPSNASFIPIIFLIGIYLYIWFSKNLEFYIPFFYSSVDGYLGYF